MLVNTFYSVLNQSTEYETDQDYKISAGLLLNADHPIFSGHFPGQPVVPGVCQVQMIRELIENQIQKKIRLFNADNVKFLSMIIPGQHPEVNITIHLKNSSPDQFSASAIVSAGDSIFCKFKGKFTTETTCR